MGSQTRLVNKVSKRQKLKRIKKKKKSLHRMTRRANNVLSNFSRVSNPRLQKGVVISLLGRRCHINAYRYNQYVNQTSVLGCTSDTLGATIHTHDSDCSHKSLVNWSSLGNRSYTKQRKKRPSLSL